MIVRGIPIALIAGACIACVATPARAATHATAAGVAAATVVSPLRVVAVAPMDFGQITHVDGSTGTVTVSPGAAGAQFSGGASAACAGSACVDAHAARFAVTGEPQRNYTIQLPATIVATGTALSGTGAAIPALTVNGLTVRSASSASAPRLDAAGTDKFEVGGTIALPADLPAAHYRASFTVIVSYI